MGKYARIDPLVANQNCLIENVYHFHEVRSIRYQYKQQSNMFVCVEYWFPARYSFYKDFEANELRTCLIKISSWGIKTSWFLLRLLLSYGLNTGHFSSGILFNVLPRATMSWTKAGISFWAIASRVWNKLYLWTQKRTSNLNKWVILVFLTAGEICQSC